ncbi:MAG TPA: PAS domain S-box protein [Deltaproteobacteria bacterium]|nr:PAS domain S-box protein [Deltaproteobacteria bacterium]
MTTEKAAPGDEGVARLRWLIFLRLFILSFLLGIAALIQSSGDEAVSDSSLYLVFAIIGVTYVLSIFYIVLPRFLAGAALNVSLQAIIDVTLITALVYVTGGVGSIYSILYPLVIIYGALFMGRRGALLIASLAAICYGGLLDLEYFGYIHSMYGDTNHYSFTAGYVFSRMFIHIVFFYIIAVLAAFVVERERRVTSLLTEREDSFRRLDLLHKSIIESVNVGIVTIDREGAIRSFNRAAEEITGRRRYQVMKRNIEEVAPGIARILAGRDTERRMVETTETSADGREMIVGCSLSPLLDSSMQQVGNIIIFRDLTAMKTMEREVERNKKMAFLGEMSAVLAHELRNPLASISGSIQLLRRDLPLDEGDRKLMDIIERGRNQLETLAGDFLLLARSRAAIPEDDIDASVLVDEVLDSARMGNDWNGGINLVRRYDEKCRIRGNRTEVRHAVMNIISNALQAMPEVGELAVETRSTGESPSGNGGFIEIEIRDTGNGIDPGILKNVREPFFTTRESGTGLGLAIVDRVMANHGGYFRIEAATGRGTRAVLGFPVHDDAVNSGE